MSRGVGRLPEQQGLAFRCRQQPGQHLHGRGLAATIGAEKAKDFSALDGEVHAIDGSKVAEPAGEIARDDDRFRVEDRTWRNMQRFVSGPLLRGECRNEGILDASARRTSASIALASR